MFFTPTYLLITIPMVWNFPFYRDTIIRSLLTPPCVQQKRKQLTTKLLKLFITSYMKVFFIINRYWKSYSIGEIITGLAITQEIFEVWTVNRTSRIYKCDHIAQVSLTYIMAGYKCPFFFIIHITRILFALKGNKWLFIWYQKIGRPIPLYTVAAFKFLNKCSVW